MVRKLTKRITLVPNWQRCWKWATVQLSSLYLVVVAALDIIQHSFNMVPPHILEKIPHSTDFVSWLFVLNIIARLFTLKPKELKNANKE